MLGAGSPKYEVLRSDEKVSESDHLGVYGALTPFPPRGFRRALSPRAPTSVRPLRLAPWASGVAPGLVRTARARCTWSLE